jgi:Cytochrome b5-like Heme/Steroid binding domain
VQLVDPILEVFSTMVDEDFKGSLWKKAPPRDVDRKGGEHWLELRRKEEGAEGLWRIHNKLYNLSSFIKIHPGGSEWLELTKVRLIKHIYFLPFFNINAEQSK